MMAENRQASAAPGRKRGRGPGRPFEKGNRANPGGRPKGIPNFRVLRLFGDAFNDPGARLDAVRGIRQNLRPGKALLPTLELAARVNKEIGLGTNGDMPGGVTINFISNLKPGSLRRRPK